MDFDDIICKVRKRIESIRGFAKSNRYSGYDPYDILAHPFIRRALYVKDALFFKFIAPFVGRMVYHFPYVSRKIFSVKPSINPKGMGLFAYAYLRMFELTGDKEYLLDAEYCLRWLTENYSKGYSGYAWGYPFDWQSRIFIPRYTPSVVVSVNVGLAFLKHFELTNNTKSLEVANSVAKFILNDINIDEIDARRLCFSYTPLDHFHIHNANMLASSYMFELSRFVDEPIFIDYATRALNYTLEDQASDGSFEYWGKEDRKGSHIDLYHTGFVLRALKTIYQITGSDDVKSALVKGCDFFIANFFTHDGIPKTYIDRVYPIDIHSVAESILVLSTIDEFERATRKNLLLNIFNFCENNMVSKDGYYFYQMRGRRRIKVPYMRWAQAWMIRALVEYLWFLRGMV